MESAVRPFLDELATVVHDSLVAWEDEVELDVDPLGAARLVVATTRAAAPRCRRRAS